MTGDVVMGDEPGPDEAFCPVCGQASGSLKWFQLPFIVFLILIVAWSHEDYVACPDCMRRHLAKRCLAALFLSNIFWPFLVVWYGCQYGATFARGSNVSPEILLRYQTPPEAAPSALAPKPSIMRALFVLGILAAIVAILIICVKN